MADTIYSYYSVKLDKTLAVALGYENPRALLSNKIKVLNGRVAIQITRPPVNSVSPFKYEFNYSFCSPIDNFSKSKARNICKVRKNSGKCSLSLTSEQQLKARELSELAIDKLFSLDSNSSCIKLPKWLEFSQRNHIVPERKV